MKNNSTDNISKIYSSWYKKLLLKNEIINDFMPLIIRAARIYFGIKEEWRCIDGYNEKYSVSNFGRVISHARYRNGKGGLPVAINERILKIRESNNGYIQVCLYGRVTKMESIHRLVAIAFLRNKQDKMTVNHKDGIRSNNFFYNLEWATYGENMYHAIHVLGKKHPPSQKGKTGARSKSSKPVDKLDMDGTYMCSYAGIHEAARLNNTSFQNIWHALNGNIKSSGGFKWRYANPK